MIARRPVTAAEIYSSVAAPDHAVQFYESDSSLIKLLAHEVIAALKSGDVVIVNATRKHRNALRAALALRKIDLAAAVRAGRFREVDATECLAKFMVNGTPDKDRFDRFVGALIDDAATALKPGRRPVLFGEMVAVLWNQGQRKATIRLEELWRDLARRKKFHLLCSYPIHAFGPSKFQSEFSNICGDHTHVNAVAALRLASLCRITQRRLVRLQQKTSALEAEIQLNRQQMQLLEQAAQAGAWELDSAGDVLMLSPAAAKVLGYGRVSHVPLSKFFDLMYYSGDREAIWKHVQAAQQKGIDFKAKFRIRRGRGTRLIEMQCRTLSKRDPRVTLGVFTDVTTWASWPTAGFGERNERLWTVPGQTASRL
jgi:PAS domain-containing protein